MKYKTIGAFKNVQNVPYCKAASDMQVGMGVILDRVNKTATLPTTAAEAKTVRYIVSNINDKPEQHNFSETLTVKEGEYVRADDLFTVDGLEIEFAADEITGGTTNLEAGDTLVFGTDGKLVEGTPTGYAVYFKVIKKTSYMLDGVLAEIVKA